jgi:23S rRNA (uracil1939-C5)-methyltransferase
MRPAAAGVSIALSLFLFPLQILEPSPLRVVPPCPLFGACGGCQYQFMPIGEQRRLKRSHVAGVLSRIGGFDAPAVLEVVGTDEVS